MEKLVNIHIKTENALITRISDIVKDFKVSQKPSVDNNSYNIKKKIKKEGNGISVLTNIFKEIIKKEVKKNRV